MRFLGELASLLWYRAVCLVFRVKDLTAVENVSHHPAGTHVPVLTYSLRIVYSTEIVKVRDRAMLFRMGEL